ncbi:glycosyltransferase [Gloeocapsopsis dulcis]|uniref:Glycosyl transferase family 1 n=1 Tax=Gloeocapsopsis dulcis AAB1 = 1H9 TaxID=1433147 RepID=A0A6N8G0C7_9CHRO|nr:glycosyltransferase [Gloeocapsopsis dulcis]MUL38559.1 glycosyl transferase family 1 [Gloeocapsopsis dulcis AAB1 = 1H9]WNN90688.1 glycosyltransferase [Gloeocapsopsis dulcis]
MTHFGILCPSSPSHINAMTALGRELVRRGHRVTLIQVPELESQALATGLEFQAIGEKEFPSGILAEKFAQLGQLSGLRAIAFTLDLIKQGGTIILRDAPEIITSIGIEALLVDQVSPESATVAKHLNLPFITICNALILNQEPGIPPFVTTWQPNTAWWALLRNGITYAVLERVAQPVRQVLDEYHRKWNLPLYKKVADSLSDLAQISQQPAEFEFPRTHLPECFHFAGPFVDPAGRKPIPFPYEKLTEQPLIYASMGTLQNQQQKIFQAIAAACANLDVQLVISLGGSSTPETLPKLAGKPLVVQYAPQLELLQKAILTITHAGLNTALESLSNGVPMVAIPITNDQPGVAARIAWTRTGEFVPLSRLSVPRLQMAVQQVLTNETYKQNALRLQQAIHQAGGVRRAADVIEQAVSTGKPVLNHSNF